MARTRHQVLFLTRRRGGTQRRGGLLHGRRSRVSSLRLRALCASALKNGFVGHFRDAAPVGLRLATKCPSQRHRSRETAIERSTEPARQRQLRAPLVSLLEPILEEDAVEARFFAQMKDEDDQHAAEDRGIVLMPLGSFRCRPVSVVRSFPFPSVAQVSGTQA